MKDGLIDEAHRKELLRFLLVKTAAVRCGVKPGELLRVRHCYEDRNDQGLRICLNRRDIYFCLKLDYIELRVEEGSSLVLFYNPEKLARTLSERRNRYWLAKVGYGQDGTMDDYLRELRTRFEQASEPKQFPHEVGIFIGYPLKDVIGFVKHLPATPLHNGTWRVYGNVLESVRRMRLFKAIEDFAGTALSQSSDLEGYFSALKQY